MLKLEPTEDVRDGEKVFLINHYKAATASDGTSVEVVDYSEGVTLSELEARKVELQQNVDEVSTLIQEVKSIQKEE